MSERSGLTKSEQTKVLQATTSARDLAILTLGFNHGFRSSEIAALSVSDLDFVNNQLIIRRGKGSDTNVHQFLPSELPILRGALSERPSDPSPFVFVSRKGGKLSRAQVFRIFQAAATKAGLPKQKRHYHCAKHTLAFKLVKGGATLPEVQKYLGWKSLATAGFYLAVSDETACAAAQRVLD